MTDYKFYYPIQIRYSDLDPQWHINNSRFLTYIESARLAYIQHLNLWDGISFRELGLIVADAHLVFLKPIVLGQNIRVGIRVTRIGNKSLDFDYQIEDADNGKVMGTATTVMVAYNYHTLSTIPVTDEWRKAIISFEQLSTP
jgi:acyl-CoA thioester hydrolase